LRQEFRELEILDYITDLRHHGILPSHIEGHCRNTFMRAYQLWKKNECPDNMHPAICWDESNPFHLMEYVEDQEWAVIHPKWVEVNGMQIVTKLPEQDIDERPPGMRPMNDKAHNEHNEVSKEITQLQTQMETGVHCGFKWDSTYSCAYDALMMILFNIWNDKPSKWDKH
ncbi:hypothetical protein NEOLEDRAFT_1025631, partial [Neolentinus lepideus HHB14362 ss-1]